MTNDELYFGYGSNLNEDDWNSSGHYLPWKEALQLQTAGFLLDYVPVYHYYSSGRKGGALDVRPLKGGVVSGMLFRPSMDGWINVEKKEGSPNYYSRKSVQIQTISGELLEAVTYIVVTEQRKNYFVEPNEKYKKIVENGMYQLGLDPKGQNAAAENREDLSKCNHVFVYGTLKQGFLRQESMLKGRVATPHSGKIRGELLDLGAYPGLIQGDNEIIGEIHSFNDISPVLDRLDEIEGFYGHGSSNNLFDRILCNVETTDGMKQAWTYRWIGLNGTPIESGEWTKK
tara:strand:+ start:3459 stop:4316 length:858 start_codon:yes stop_codon:yes gene_type:complete